MKWKEIKVFRYRATDWDVALRLQIIRNFAIDTMEVVFVFIPAIMNYQKRDILQEQKHILLKF